MPRVVYGLSRAFTPAYEAVSKQIEALRGDREDKVVAVLPVASNPLQLRDSASVLTGHPVPLLLGPWHRAIRSADVVHVFSPFPLPRRIHWLVQTARDRTLLSVTSLDIERVQPNALDGWGEVVVECARDRDLLLGKTGTSRQIDVVHPPAVGVEGGLELPPRDPPTLLFASWPFRRAELESRGLDLLAAAARQMPQVRFLVATRPGSEVQAHDLGFPTNVELIEGVVPTRDLYLRVHAVLAPFRGKAQSKSVPNTLVEGMMAGRPAITSETVGLAPLVREYGAGAVHAAEGADLVEAIEATLADLPARASAAQRCAGTHFAPESFRRAYDGVYLRMVSRAAASSSA